MKTIVAKPSTNATLTCINDLQELEKCTHLDVRDYKRHISLQGIERCTGLVYLVFADTLMKNFEQFSGIQLHMLYVSFNKITRIDGIEEMKALQQLGLHYNQIINPLVLMPLKKLKQLTRLLLYNNPILHPTPTYLTMGCIIEVTQPNTSQINLTDNGNAISHLQLIANFRHELTALHVIRYYSKLRQICVELTTNNLMLANKYSMQFQKCQSIIALFNKQRCAALQLCDHGSQ